ncbi:heparinase II/III family protein [Aestuariibius insulae]|uniref:heparinase II/III family protein n=1 Tax=Aestuariibius insulae TaxID=2058287 RepID=UPI00345E3044
MAVSDAQPQVPLRVGFLDRVHARWATRGSVRGTFAVSPEPRSIGHLSRGRQLAAGDFLFAGDLIRQPGSDLWQIDPPTPRFEAELHRFGWLADLAALGGAKGRTIAQRWVLGWIDAFGDGTGPGWTPELTGRRLIECVHHSQMLLRKLEPADADRIRGSLRQQAVFLGRRWTSAPGGLARFEALTGLLIAACAIEGLDRFIGPASDGLSRAATKDIDAGGGIPTRNPEDLLSLFTLLQWAEGALAEAGHEPRAGHQTAMERIAPVLRALRHSDGGLARFHGGGRGVEGRLDEALAGSGLRAAIGDGPHMGYARLASGRTTILADAAPPPMRAFSLKAHAATCAFEMTSGRRPLIVNCGPGADFGPVWSRASRATPSQSTLGLEGVSSSRIAKRQNGNPLVEGPQEVGVQFRKHRNGTRLELSHDGYTESYGLTHRRSLELSRDGRSLSGEDMLVAAQKMHEIRFDRIMKELDQQGVGFTIRFHLHPDVQASLDEDLNYVRLTLMSGEVWNFGFEGYETLALDPSVYLERGNLKPQTTQQIVLTGRAMSYSTRVRWILAKSQTTPDALRDLNIEMTDADE